MKSKTTETDRATEWSIVINKPTDTSVGLSLKKLFNTLKSVYQFVAIIEHDQDVNDDGTPKTKHYHTVITTKRMRKGTLLNDLTELLDIPSNCISIDRVKSMRGALRYLIHMDDDDKTQYAPFMVLTNNESYYNSALIERIELITPENLIEIVDKYVTTRQILLHIGLENYKKWAMIIRDLQKARD